MTGHTVRLRELAPYARRRRVWDRAVLVMFGAPERIWTVAELTDAVWADDPWGGPETNSLVGAICLHRHELPPGWRLVTLGQRGYRLVWEGALVQRAA